jgi:hypothetical protein
MPDICVTILHYDLSTAGEIEMGHATEISGERYGGHTAEPSIMLRRNDTDCVGEILGRASCLSQIDMNPDLARTR